MHPSPTQPILSEYYPPFVPWTLQQRIEDLIRENGGRLRLASYIEQEWVKAKKKQAKREQYKPIQIVRQCKWTKNELRYLQKNYYTMTSDRIGIHLHRTGKAVRSKMDEIRRNGI